MKKDFTDIIIVLDRSGSMHTIKNDIEGGFDQFIKDQSEVGTAQVTLAQFDDVYEVVYEALDIKEVPKMKLIPRSSTALLDAIGRTIVAGGERLAKMPEDERPDQVMLVIITDGEENSSEEYTRERVFELIKHQEDKYNWDIIYLGANQDAIHEGGMMGFTAGKSMTFNANARGVQGMFAATSQKMANSRIYKSSFEYDDSDRTEAEQE